MLVVWPFIVVTLFDTFVCLACFYDEIVFSENRETDGYGEVGRYQLTQGLSLASENTAGTNGPSSELQLGMVSESCSTDDCLFPCLSYK